MRVIYYMALFGLLVLVGCDTESGEHSAEIGQTKEQVLSALSADPDVVVISLHVTERVRVKKESLYRIDHLKESESIVVQGNNISKDKPFSIDIHFKNDKVIDVDYSYWVPDEISVFSAGQERDEVMENIKRILQNYSKSYGINVVNDIPGPTSVVLGELTDELKKHLMKYDKWSYQLQTDKESLVSERAEYIVSFFFGMVCWRT